MICLYITRHKKTILIINQLQNKKSSKKPFIWQAPISTNRQHLFTHATE